MKHFLIPILLFCSCRFAAPFPRTRIDRFTTIDSTGDSTISTYFHYLNFRRTISIGGGEKMRTYDANGKLIYKMVSKATRGAMKDGTNRYYTKALTFDANGKKLCRYRKIRQNHGRGGRIVLQDTLRYHERDTK